MTKYSAQMLDQILSQVDEVLSKAQKAEEESKEKKDEKDKMEKAAVGWRPSQAGPSKKSRGKSGGDAAQAASTSMTPAASIKKDDEIPEEAPAEEPAPEMEAPSEEPPMPPEEAAAPAPEEAPEEAPAEEPAPEEAPSEEAPEAPAEEAEELEELSDEDLQEIYGSMSPEELERHYMICRDALAQKYEMDKEEHDDHEEDEESDEEVEKCGDITKSEPAVDAEKEELKAKLAKAEEGIKSLEVQLTRFVTAFENNVKSRRRSFEGIEYVAKSEEAPKPLSKAETTQILKELTAGNKLSAEDRSAINDYYLGNGSEEKIVKIIGKFGGK
jgi:hypothetical protein